MCALPASRQSSRPRPCFALLKPLMGCLPSLVENTNPLFFGSPKSRRTGFLNGTVLAAPDLRALAGMIQVDPSISSQRMRATSFRRCPVNSKARTNLGNGAGTAALSSAAHRSRISSSSSTRLRARSAGLVRAMPPTMGGTKVSSRVAHQLKALRTIGQASSRPLPARSRPRWRPTSRRCRDAEALRSVCRRCVHGHACRKLARFGQRCASSCARADRGSYPSR